MDFCRLGSKKVYDLQIDCHSCVNVVDIMVTAYNYKGLYVSIIISFCAMPWMRVALSHPVVSQYLPMYILIYGLLLTSSIFFVYALPPQFLCCNKKKRISIKRDEIYYGCCLLMCCCFGGLTFQTWRLKKFGAGLVKHKVEFFVYDERYVLSPHHMMTEIWMDVINYFFYASIIFMIDNNFNHRNVALYWSGATITAELVTTLGCFTGIHSPNLQYSEYMHVVHIVAALWIVFKFMVLKPRYLERQNSTTSFATFDQIMIVCLILLSMFSAFRGVAALNGSQSLVKKYVARYEPYIVHPARFGAIWILFLAVYGIPFQLATVRGLLKPGSEWLIDMSVLYAGSVLQGTIIYLSYSFFPSSDRKYRIPSSSLYGTIFFNGLLIVVSHLLMYRCLKDQGYFHSVCLKILKPPSPLCSRRSICTR